MSGRFRVLYSPEALDDLRAIYTHIAFRLGASGTAKRQLDRIRREIRSLCELPERYEAVDWEPWASMGMRRVPVDRFLVYYLVDHEAQLVSIVRVFYGGRDVPGIVRAEN